MQFLKYKYNLIVSLFHRQKKKILKTPFDFLKIWK